MASWKKTFVSAFIAQVLSIVGFFFAMPFLPFFVRDLGVTDTSEQAWWAGVALASTAITFAVFSPLWGALADRYGRKLMVMRAMFGGTVVLLLMSFARTVGELVICRLLQGALTGTMAASVALVAGVTPQHRSGFALGLMQAAVLIGASLGPLLGGVVADAFGYRAAFRVGAGVVFFGGMLVCAGTEEAPAPPAAEGDGGWRGLRTIVTSPMFLLAVLILLLVRFSTTMANPSFPLIVKEIVPSSTRINSITGSVMAAAALSGALSAAVLGHFSDRWGPRRVLMICSLGAAAACLLHAAAFSIRALVMARILFGLSVAALLPSANAVIRVVVVDRNLGKAFGVATSMSMLGVAMGPLLGGYLAKTVNLRTPFVVCAAALVGLTAVVAWAMPARGRERST